MSDKIVVRVDNVSKDFILPHLQANSMKSLVTGFYRSNSAQRSKNEVQSALKNISFNVEEGEFFGIVGRNGSGKSTLLKILAGIYQPTKGGVSVIGKLVPFIELGVGFNPELTGRENVYMNGALLGFSQQEIDAMYDGIVAFAELERFMDQKLKNYSSGMQVRLAFSMATRSEADVLLVDEVLAVGDADFQKKCFEYFRTLKKNKKTVIFVSHDMNAVREYCDRAVLIDNSEIIIESTAEEVSKEYSRLFLPKAKEEKDEPKKNKRAKWGAGGLDILSVKVSNKVLQMNDKEQIVTVTAQADETFEYDIVPGFVIKNTIGQIICGTNSNIIRAKTIAPKAGQKFVMRWNIPNIFNEGTYIIEPAIANGKNMETCQWWDGAQSFEVVNEQKTPYLVAPIVTLEVEAK